ncbi:hypothetical protein HPB49_003041 [Dermacentor silvarum]|uniref:Uncharacterized protein n=1 Tax=Dermacentor silvarum TaxID=543639 RepID=A0ACB8DSY1_DERSI|nr:hypothetical protein HPB49_003041 [Dermacentor silvarum]
MGDGAPPRPPDKASPAAVALSVGNRDITNYRLPDSSESSTAAEMESHSDYTLVQSRHLKHKLRRKSAGSDSTHKSRCDERVFSVGYTPTTAGTNLNSLNRQSLTKFFDRIASGHVREVRINARKNILTVDVSSQAVLEALKSIEVVGNIPVRSFLAYGNDTCTGVVSDVDIDIKDEDLRSLLSNAIFVYPSHPEPAPFHYQPLLKPFNYAYTAIFNVLGYPTCQCPVGISPLGVQVVAAFYKDHLCLDGAREVEKAFCGWLQPPTE